MHTNVFNDKKYIGITCQEPWTKRFNGGNGNGYKECIAFYNAIQKYGWNNFKHDIITTCETEEQAIVLEKFFIAKYRTTESKFGYNIKEGGQTQRIPESVRRNISNALKGRDAPNKGKHHSEETKKKIRDAQKGRPLTPEHAENCRKATREYYKTHSPAHAFTEEDHKACLEARRMKIRIVESGETFDSMTECAEYLHVLISNLSKAIKENRKYKGFHFEKVCS